MPAAAPEPVRLLQEALRCLQAGRTAEGEELSRRVLRLQPGNPDAFHLLGLNMLRASRPRDAAEQIERAIAINGRFAPFHNSLGTAWAETGDLDKAAQAFKRAIELQPNYPEALSNLGAVFKNLRRYDEAIEMHRRAIALKPDYADAHNNLGHVLLRQEGAAAAVNAYREAVRLRPNNPRFRNNLAAALIDDDRLDEAIAELQQVLKLQSAYPEAYANLGRAFADAGRYGEALTAYRTARRFQADHADSLYGEAQLLLLQGDYGEGWAKYDARWRINVQREPARHQGLSKWDGSSLESRCLLVWDEQGVGDKIMFAKALPELFKRSANCVIEVEPRLIPLFTRSFPEARAVVSSADNVDVGKAFGCDVQLPIGSLCRWLLPDPGKSTQRHGYMRADEATISLLRANYRKLLGDRPLVGVSWRGGTGKKKRLRSIPMLELAPIIRQSEFAFVSLQYGDIATEAAELRGALNLEIHIDGSVNALQDLDRFAAQVAAMDLVISVDNSTVHMAGALGAPVWVMLPVVPESRWQLGRRDSPWYPSARLFRQKKRGDWGTLIAEIAEALKLFDCQKASPAGG
jgi:tetratricopeptide (TPR) repeat protein